jgi:hypothetical protein
MRSQYNILVTRLTASGSHSADDDLILHAYNRCGVEGRPKDVGLFYYYMMVKDADLEFLTAVLFEDEVASQVGANEPVSGPSETSYAKRQRIIKVAAEKRETAFTERNMSAIKSFMSPGEDGKRDTSSLDESTINRNNANGRESDTTAEYYKTLSFTEDSKKKSLEIENIMKVMGNSVIYNILYTIYIIYYILYIHPRIYNIFSDEDKAKMNVKLKTLMGLD